MALAFANDLLKDQAWDGYYRALDSWQNLCSTAAHSGGGVDLPDPPDVPED